jgi:hypothetical protein
MAWLRALIAYDLEVARHTASSLMPICPSIPCPLVGVTEAVSASLLAVTWPEAVDHLSAHAPAAVLIAMAFGIFVGWLAVRRIDVRPTSRERSVGRRCGAPRARETDFRLGGAPLAP